MWLCVLIRKQLTVIPTSATQRSPMEKPFTFLPISTMVPIASCPGMSWIYAFILCSGVWSEVTYWKLGNKFSLCNKLSIVYKGSKRSSDLINVTIRATDTCYYKFSALSDKQQNDNKILAATRHYRDGHLESEIWATAAHIRTFKQYFVVIDLRYGHLLDNKIPGLYSY